MGRHGVQLPVIAPAVGHDCDAAVALWETCGLIRPWNDARADFARALASQNATVFLAREDEALRGSVMVGDDGHRGWIYYLAVAPQVRGQGVGRALMAAAEAWLRARGVPKLQLMVREDNVAALGFYAALGLEPQRVVTLGRFLEKVQCPSHSTASPTATA